MFVFRLSQFVISLLPQSPSLSEKSVVLCTDMSLDVARASPVGSAGSSELFDASGSPVVFRIRLRNALLHIILRLASQPTSSSGASVNVQLVPYLLIVNVSVNREFIYR